tara:strand:+ start:884 stop:1561 length:678 start_codon:yes stop_codon:yes gene_type:complete
MTTEDKIEEILAECEKAPWKHPHVSDWQYTHFSHCFPHVSVDGLWVEFGVYKGKTISTIAEYRRTYPNNLVYGFDSFEGLNEDWDKDNPKGSYSLGGEAPKEINIDGVRKPWAENIKLIKGYFEDTLPTFLTEHKEPAAFLHIDSDLYSSAKTVLTLMKGRIVTGTVICFDDWCGYPDTDREGYEDREHEVKAFAEFLLETKQNYEALALQTFPTYSQVGFKIIS